MERYRSQRYITLTRHFKRCARAFVDLDAMQQTTRVGSRSHRALTQRKWALNRIQADILKERDGVDAWFKAGIAATK